MPDVNVDISLIKMPSFTFKLGGIHFNFFKPQPAQQELQPDPKSMLDDKPHDGSAHGNAGGLKRIAVDGVAKPSQHLPIATSNIIRLGEAVTDTIDELFTPLRRQQNMVNDLASIFGVVIEGLNASLPTNDRLRIVKGSCLSETDGMSSDTDKKRSAHAYIYLGRNQSWITHRGVGFKLLVMSIEKGPYNVGECHYVSVYNFNLWGQNLQSPADLSIISDNDLIKAADTLLADPRNLKRKMDDVLYHIQEAQTPMQRFEQRGISHVELVQVGAPLRLDFKVDTSWIPEIASHCCEAFIDSDAPRLSTPQSPSSRFPQHGV